MQCFSCYHQITVTSVWFCKKNNYQYSYICHCTNLNCSEYLVKFKKSCKSLAEIHKCRHFQLTHQ